jgi:hypothetical protein
MWLMRTGLVRTVALHAKINFAHQKSIAAQVCQLIVLNASLIAM